MSALIKVCLTCSLDTCRPNSIKCEYNRRYPGVSESTMMQKRCGVPDSSGKYGPREKSHA